MRTNIPPHAVLELDKDETRWLFALLAKAERSADMAFDDVASMSSKDPRARFRASLQLGANIDQAFSDNLLRRLERQDEKLERADAKILTPTDNTE